MIRSATTTSMTKKALGSAKRGLYTPYTGGSQQKPRLGFIFGKPEKIWSESMAIDIRKTIVSSDGSKYDAVQDWALTRAGERLCWFVRRNGCLSSSPLWCKYSPRESRIEALTLARSVINVK